MSELLRRRQCRLFNIKLALLFKMGPLSQPADWAFSSNKLSSISFRLRYFATFRNIIEDHNIKHLRQKILLFHFSIDPDCNFQDDVKGWSDSELWGEERRESEYYELYFADSVAPEPPAQLQVSIYWTKCRIENGKNLPISKYPKQEIAFIPALFHGYNKRNKRERKKNWLKYPGVEWSLSVCVWPNQVHLLRISSVRRKLTS